MYMRIFDMFPEKGYRGEHFQNKEIPESALDLSGYFEGDLSSLLGLIKPTEEEIALYGIARVVEE